MHARPHALTSTHSRARTHARTRTLRHEHTLLRTGAVWIFELAVDVFFGLDLIVNFCTGIIDDKGAEVGA